MKGLISEFDNPFLRRRNHPLTFRTLREYLKRENEVLRARLPKRIHTTKEERKKLLNAGRGLGKAIEGLISIVSPKTFSRWLHEESKPIERIARIVNVDKPEPENATGQPSSIEASEIRFKLADGSILRFEPVKARDGQLIGRSTIYGEVSIPIVNIVELQIGDFKHDGFTPLFSDWVVRPSKEPQFGKMP